MTASITTHCYRSTPIVVTTTSRYPCVRYSIVTISISTARYRYRRHTCRIAARRRLYPISTLRCKCSSRSRIGDRATARTQRRTTIRLRRRNRMLRTRCRIVIPSRTAHCYLRTRCVVTTASSYPCVRYCVVTITISTARYRNRRSTRVTTRRRRLHPISTLRRKRVRRTATTVRQCAARTAQRRATSSSSYTRLERSTRTLIVTCRGHRCSHRNITACRLYWCQCLVTYSHIRSIPTRYTYCTTT